MLRLKEEAAVPSLIGQSSPGCWTERIKTRCDRRCDAETNRWRVLTLANAADALESFAQPNHKDAAYAQEAESA